MIGRCPKIGIGNYCSNPWPFNTLNLPEDIIGIDMGTKDYAATITIKAFNAIPKDTILVMQDSTVSAIFKIEHKMKHYDFIYREKLADDEARRPNSADFRMRTITIAAKNIFDAIESFLKLYGKDDFNVVNITEQPY